LLCGSVKDVNQLWTGNVTGTGIPDANHFTAWLIALNLHADEKSCCSPFRRQAASILTKLMAMSAAVCASRLDTPSGRAMERDSR
jgi:hypothetical protein